MQPRASFRTGRSVSGNGTEITERTVAQEERRNGERTEKTNIDKPIEGESSPFNLRRSVSPVSPFPPRPPCRGPSCRAKSKPRKSPKRTDGTVQKILFPWAEQARPHDRTSKPFIFAYVQPPRPTCGPMRQAPSRFRAPREAPRSTASCRSGPDTA